ncbi:hypothetical protein [Achromobacter pulmonis]|uniref:hypothetical protein n=1 Tax=Achromobacter pulmonis TaxID=1389932 RepID=UPI003016430C
MNRRSASGAFSGTSTASSGVGWWGCSGDADSAPQSADFSNEQVRCVACQHFTLREVPKYAELGLGRCVGMVDRPGTFVSPTYPRKCHQYQPAPQAKVAARIEWLRDLRGEEP